MYPACIHSCPRTPGRQRALLHSHAEERGLAAPQRTPADSGYKPRPRMTVSSSYVEVATVEAPPGRDTPSSSHGTAPSEAARKSAFTTERPPQQSVPFEVPVDGSLPAWLSGSIVRNGSGFYAPEMQHMFDGYGMLVKFIFENGKVKTMQRCVESTAYTEYVKTGQMQFSEFGTPLSPAKAVWGMVKSLLKLGQGFTDNASVNTHSCLDGASLVAMTEAVPGFFRVDLDTLATKSRVRFGGDGVSGDLTSAHPVMYPDGTMYNLFVDFGRSRCVAEVDPKTQKRKKLADIPTDNLTAPSWIHDLPATENYIIVPDTPVVYDTKALLFGGGEYVVFKWDPSGQRTKFHVVPRRGGAVRTFEAPFDYMTFHYTNAFESADGSELYLDTTAFKDPTMVNLLKLGNLRNLTHSVNSGPLSRITIPLNGKAPSIRTLVPEKDYTFAELPRVNPGYRYKDYQYAYAVSAKLPASYGNALTKFDVRNGTFKQWQEPGTIPTEPLMIPRPGATSEDDGVVTSLVTGADGLSFLLVLDAASFAEVARARLPYGIAYGFHNQFYPA